MADAEGRLHELLSKELNKLNKSSLIECIVYKKVPKDTVNDVTKSYLNELFNKSNVVKNVNDSDTVDSGNVHVLRSDIVHLKSKNELLLDLNDQLKARITDQKLIIEILQQERSFCESVYKKCSYNNGDRKEAHEVIGLRSPRAKASDVAGSPILSKQMSSCQSIENIGTQSVNNAVNNTQTPEVSETLSQKDQKTTKDRPQITPYSIVIRNKTGHVKDVKEVIEKEIDPCQLKVGVLGMSKTKKGDVIIRCENEDNMSKLKKEIDGKMGNSVTTEETKLFRPRIKLTGIKNIDHMLNEDLEKAIIQQNEFDKIENFYLKLVLKIQNKIFNDTTLILEIDENTLEEIKKNNNRVRIKWNTVVAKEHIYIKRCFNCWGFNHEGKQCKTEKICGKCNSRGHKEENCDGKEDMVSCPNCVIAVNKYKLDIDGNHNVRDIKCPCYQRLFNMLKGRVNKPEQNF